MKKTLILTAILSAALMSCQKNDDRNDIVPGASAAPECFRAEYGDNLSPSTKVVLDKSTYGMVWEDADRIVVNGATYVRNDEHEYFRYYSGGYTTNPDGSIVALYPTSLYTGGTAASSAKYSLPYEYTWNTSTGKVDYIPLAGKADSENLITFKNLVSLFRVTITNSSGTDCWLKSVTLSSDKSMSGDFNLSFSGGNPVLSFPSSGSVYPSVSIVLDNVVKLSTGAHYDVLVPVPAQAYTQFNVKVMAYVAEGEGYADIRFYNSSATTETGKSATVPSLTCERGIVYGLNVNATALTSGIEGDGTAVNPYKIGSIEDLKYVQMMVKNAGEISFKHFTTSYYTLTNDIVLDGPWTSTLSSSIIGKNYGFEGVLDGDGHTIDATAATNTASIFWDMKGAVIKHLSLKGDFLYHGNACTWCPFMAAAIDASMVAVMFEGSVYGDGWAQPGWGSLCAFGHYGGASYVVGCYAQMETDSTNAAWSGYSLQMFGKISSSYSGRKGPYSYGVIGDLSRSSGPGTTTVPISVHSVNDAISPYQTAPDMQTKMEELHQSICGWNNDLKTKLSAGKITQEEYNRKVSRYTYSIVENKLKLVDKNE